MSAEPLRVVLCWHMHQPEYRDPVSGQYQAPWTYLHAIKDYTDMAAHLEAAPPEVRVVVNFPPVLLEQIDDYAARVDGCLKDGTAIGDPLLDALANPAMPADLDERHNLLTRCLHANQARMIDPFPVFDRLTSMARLALESESGLGYLSDRHLEDLLVWYHLSWLGETVRRGEPSVRALMEQQESYSHSQRRYLLSLIARLLGELIGRYRTLAEHGVVELSTSPYTHTMLPLLIDLTAAREAQPELPLPESAAYPGGEERVRWQLARAREVFHHYFGFEPAGCWPSEGGLSKRTVQLIGEAGFHWTASGQGVLRHSLNDGEDNDGDGVHRPWHLGGNGPLCFFRDDGLSDLIGFTYQTWHSKDAVADFIHHLNNIAHVKHALPGRVVSVILDGENPWEHYADNGFYFLESLYRSLADSKTLQMARFADVVAEPRDHVRTLPRLVAGSWVYGNFDTWIGDADKNRAWDLLCRAKAVVDRLVPSVDKAARDAIARQLAVCEGSDWFWWFGDYNPAEAVSEFDRLYRLQLRCLYQLLNEPPPAELEQELSHGSGHPELGGAMRRAQQ